MLKKKSINEVNPELKTLLIQNNTADVVIGNSFYELYPFTTFQMFKFMKQLGEYNRLYQSTIEELKTKNPQATMIDFLAILVDSLDKQEFIIKAIKDIQPNIDDEDLELMTYEQLLYFITKVYELNFFTSRMNLTEKEKEIMNQVKASLGLQV